MMRLGEWRPNPRSSDPEVEKASKMDASSAAPAVDDERTIDEFYRLLSVDAVRAPEGCTGGDWHIYRITQGANGIIGYRRGDLAGVRTEVVTIVAALNERRQWTKSKAPSMGQRRAAAAARRAAAK